MLLEAHTSWGATPLDWAGVLGSRAAGDVLIARGARLTLPAAAGLGLTDLPQGDVDAAFVLACRNGHTDVARTLLARGADVNARGFFAGTGLHWAAINGHEGSSGSSSPRAPIRRCATRSSTRTRSAGRAKAGTGPPSRRSADLDGHLHRRVQGADVTERSRACERLGVREALPA